MIVVINKITARDAETARHVSERFRARMKAVDRRPGFVSFELWRDAADPLVLSSVTRWRSRADFDAWVASPEFKEAHARHWKVHAKAGEASAMTSEVSIQEVLEAPGAAG